MPRILHIAAHMGGGVGKALSGLAASDGSGRFCHEFLLLEEPEKTGFALAAKAHGVNVRVAQSYGEICSLMEAADIVELEWWHHPKVAALMAKFPRVPVRLVVWCHISGCYYPYIPPAFLHLPEKFVFTSEYSFENPFWDERDRTYAREHAAAVMSSGGFDGITSAMRSCGDNVAYEDGAHHKGDGFVIGYMGTQSYSKLHPDFMEFCKSAAKTIPGVRFRMAGDRTNETALIEEARRCGLLDKFTFDGYVSDVSGEFSKMDVFGYILNPLHFGTTENVLLEAMAAGLVVVCLDQCTEKHLIKDGETGLLVKDAAEYGRALRLLYERPDERRRLGENARRYVLGHFSAKETARGLHRVYDEVMGCRKRVHDFVGVFGTEAADWFLSCLPPPLRENFAVAENLPEILKGDTKSSLSHFHRYYPDDARLTLWCRELDTITEKKKAERR